MLHHRSHGKQIYIYAYHLPMDYLLINKYLPVHLYAQIEAINDRGPMERVKKWE